MTAEPPTGGTPRDRPERVVMYHGTTAEAAASLVISGEHQPSVDSAFAEVAAAWNVREGELREYCETERALFAVTRGADGLLFLTSSHTYACAYAGLRGGESRHEIVAAAMLLTGAVDERYADAAGRLACWTEGALVRCEYPFETLAAQFGGTEQLLAAMFSQPRLLADSWAIDHSVEHLLEAERTVQPAVRIVYPGDVEWWLVALGHAAKDARGICAELARGWGPQPVSRISPPHDAFWIPDVSRWLNDKFGITLDRPPVISSPT